VAIELFGAKKSEGQAINTTVDNQSCSTAKKFMYIRETKIESGVPFIKMGIEAIIF